MEHYTSRYAVQCMYTLHCAFVRPVLEYGCAVWNPHTVNDSKRLRRVQCKFLRFASCVLEIPCPPHGHAPVANIHGLPSLVKSRHATDIKFILGISNGEIEPSTLVSLVRFGIPQSSLASFYVSYATTSYLANESFRRFNITHRFESKFLILNFMIALF